MTTYCSSNLFIYLKENKKKSKKLTLNISIFFILLEYYIPVQWNRDNDASDLLYARVVEVCVAIAIEPPEA